MKKISLFLLASLFSLGVIAQTAPAATPAVDTKAKPVKPATSQMAGGSDKTSKTGASSSKNNLKKTRANKTSMHHITPVKKATAPPETKGTSKEDLKK